MNKEKRRYESRNRLRELKRDTLEQWKGVRMQEFQKLANFLSPSVVHLSHRLQITITSY